MENMKKTTDNPDPTQKKKASMFEISSPKGINIRSHYRRKDQWNWRYSKKKEKKRKNHNEIITNKTTEINA